MSAAPVDFYFEFSSPYGYIASALADDLAGRIGRQVRWRPFLLGPVFKATGSAPLVNIPLKGDYSRHDFGRSARYYGVPFAMPPKFPIGTVAAMRAFYWADGRDAQLAKRLAKALYKAYFVEGKDIGEVPVVIEVASSLGVDAAALEAGLAEPTLKEKAKSEVDAAMARGVFGSPFFIVDGEPFWGCDRIPMLEAWLKRGGW
jgi:2-hydroxychromene-2-carboxylate isomerase